MYVIVNKAFTDTKIKVVASPANKYLNDPSLLHLSTCLEIIFFVLTGMFMPDNKESRFLACCLM